MTERKPPRVEELLERMNHLAVPEGPGDKHSVRRRRIVHAIDSRLDVLAERKRRAWHRRHSVWIVASAAAVCMLVLGAVWQTRHRQPEARATDRAGVVATLQSARGTVEVIHGGLKSRVDGAARPLELADEVQTAADAQARAVLASGALVEVRPSSALRFEPVGQPAAHGESGVEQLNLSRGAIALSVPKLGSGKRLVVRTPHATVTVRGTRFEVAVHKSGDLTRTSVVVTEGSVWVSMGSHEVVLHPGMRWTSDAERSLPSTPTVAPPEVRLERAASAAEEPKPHGRVPTADETSTLRAENEKYHGAVSAARSGNDAQAVKEFDIFLSRFPRSPLAHSAKVERFRALKRLGRTGEAARAARQYLAEYATGFAREEAKALAVESVGPPGAP